MASIKDSEFTFHPVGQGLFYSGKIFCKDKRKEFNFVYDCGNIFSGNINNHVNNYINNDLKKQHLDLFILSHYHWDHFSGLKRLLDINNGIHTIILPYISPIKRLSIALSHLGRPAYFYEFLADPVDFIKKYNKQNKNYQIIFIHNDDDKKNIGDNHKNGLDKELTLNELDDYTDNTEWGNDENVFHKTTNGRALHGICWEFLFYRRKVEDSVIHKFKKEIETIINKKLTKKDIEEFFFNKGIRKKIKNAYSKLSDPLDENINNTSLVVYHAPIRKYRVCTDGQLLTGDISLICRNIIDEIGTHFGKDRINNVFVFQIPHHGSINNWSDYIFNKFQNACLFVASGNHKKWKHPNPIIKQKVECNDKLFCDVFNMAKIAICKYTIDDICNCINKLSKNFKNLEYKRICKECLKNKQIKKFKI